MSHHIVIDAREYSTSSGRYVRNFLDCLDQESTPYRYTVLIHQEDVANYKPLNDSVTVQVIPYKKFTIAEQFGFWRYLQDLRPDLVHFAFAQQPVLYSGRKVTAILDLTPLRFNLAFGRARLFSPFRRAVYRWVVKLGAKRSEHIITISQFVKDDIVKTFNTNPQKISVTYPAADSITMASAPVESLKGASFLLYVGRVQVHKNIKTLIDAHQLLLADHPELQLVLVGKKDRAYQDLEAYIKSTKAQNIVLTGYLEDGNLRWLYEHCRAYVFPSLSEGFGLPGLEAMTHGAPVASSNASCLPEIYGDGALYFNPANVQDLAHKVERILTDKPFREELIARGHIRTKAYTWKSLTKETVKVYRKVLGD